MQVGIVLAIKTLANRFEPLNDVYREFIGDALLAEDLGFDFASTSEHHFEDDAWSPSQLPVLAYLAARTSRMRLHTNVFLLPLHDPLRVSEDAATVDILSDGRLDLICGSGSVAEEFLTWGVDPRARWGRLFEGLEVIRRSFCEEEFDYSGKHFTYPGVRQTTKPVQRPFPLWVGGFGAKLQYRAGKAGYHSQGTTRFRPEYLQGLAEAGLDPADMNVASFVSGHLAASRKKAWEECREGWWNWQNEYRKRTWIAMIDSGGVPPLPPLEDLAEPPAGVMAPLLGTPDDILAALEPMLRESDCTHFSFGFRASGGNMPAEIARPTIELFAKEVLPVLRGWGREPTTSRALDA
jgi:alkanesulfonate monooxygenase SsuD/methylene tetrahydromethanopterin reductase-like flavin-dependent oxidoreductase (luciferase family)